MPKTIAVLGSALFFVVAPLVLAGFVPWWITHWEFRPAFSGFELTRAIGLMLIIAGVPGVVDSFARFALEGLGTPAPIAPPQKLVVTGLYRYVRNPIYIAVVAVIFGQALLFGDWRLLWYGALLWLFFHVWVLMIEEPTLKQTFGTEYESFRTNVRALDSAVDAASPVTRHLRRALPSLVHASPPYQVSAGAMSAGHSRPGRASSKSGHVSYAGGSRIGH